MAACWWEQLHYHTSSWSKSNIHQFNCCRGTGIHIGVSSYTSSLRSNTKFNNFTTTIDSTKVMDWADSNPLVGSTYPNPIKCKCVHSSPAVMPQIHDEPNQAPDKDTSMRTSPTHVAVWTFGSLILGQLVLHTPNKEFEDCAQTEVQGEAKSSSPNCVLQKI